MCTCSRWCWGLTSRARLEEFLGALQQVVGPARHLPDVAGLGGAGRAGAGGVAAGGAAGHRGEPAAAAGRTRSASCWRAAGSRMDLGRAPLLRVHVAAEPGTGRWLALLQVHHLVLDHTGLEVVLGEIAALLARAGRTGCRTPLPFRDFVAQARLGVPREEHERYFAGAAGGCDRADRAVRAAGRARRRQRGAAQARVAVDAELAGRVRERARAAGVSPATVFHLAWARVLAAAGRA